MNNQQSPELQRTLNNAREIQDSTRRIRLHLLAKLRQDRPEEREKTVSAIESANGLIDQIAGMLDRHG